MTLIARVLVVIFAFLAACLAAAMVITLALVQADWSALATDAGQQSLAVAVGFSAVLISVHAMLPAMLVIAMAEGLQLRSVLFYAVGGGALALLAVFGSDSMPPAFDNVPGHGREIIVASGIVAGFVYWALAGRNAGRWREARAGNAAPS